MPNETTRGQVGEYAVRVMWGRDCGYVQVQALLLPTPGYAPTQRIIDIVNEWLTAAGEKPISHASLVAKLGAERQPHFDGYCATLEDRRTVNELIRNLKSARDGAFGRDE